MKTGLRVTLNKKIKRSRNGVTIVIILGLNNHALHLHKKQKAKIRLFRSRRLRNGRRDAVPPRQRFKTVAGFIVENDTLRRGNRELRAEVELLRRSCKKSNRKDLKRKNRNSLSLGNGMYDSLFSRNVETPDVWPDPDIWNIVYAAAPPEYSIPDREFTNELAKIVDQELLEHTDVS